MTTIDATVLVVCANQGRTLNEALAAFSVPGSLMIREVLIVDNGSQDVYTRQVLDRVSTTHLVVRNVDGNLGAAYDLGIDNTSAPAIVIVPADVAIDPNYLAAARRVLNDHVEVSFVSPTTDHPQPVDSAALVPAVGVVDILARDRVPLWSMFRREAWNRVGGFRDAAERPWSDFCLALLKGGLTGRWLDIPAAARQLSLGRRPAAPAIHVREMRELYRTHRELVSSHGTALLLEKERELIDGRQRYDALNGRRHELASELTSLHQALDTTLAELAAFGRSRVELGDFGSTVPISPVWGLDRGIPIDRYYINSFLECYRADVRGRVLEVKDAGYTRAYGNGRVESSDVIDIDPDNTEATIVADLTRADNICDDMYDCFILTQTLGVIYDVRAALGTAYRVLRPGGVLLCTLPASGRISNEGAALDGDYWRFTEASVRRLFAEVFPISAFEVVGFGNVLSCAAFLHGLSPHELSTVDLDTYDPFFPVVYGVRAVKAGERRDGAG